MMSHKKFNENISKKLISKYIEALTDNKKQKEYLESKLNDLNVTIDLNASIFYDYISSSIDITPEITDLLSQSNNLCIDNENLLNVKNTLEEKAAKLQYLIENNPNDLQEELSVIEADNKRINGLLVKKDKMIKQLRTELEKVKNASLFKTSQREIVVTVPASANIGINQELIITQNIINKVSKIHKNARMKTKDLSIELSKLYENIKLIRKMKANDDQHNSYINSNRDKLTSTNSLYSRHLKNTHNNKGISNINGNTNLKNQSALNKPIVPLINLSNIVNGRKNDDDHDINDNLDFIISSQTDEDEIEHSYDEDEEDNENCDYKHKIRARTRTKKKELEILKKEYNDLKYQNEEYEKKIEKHKIKYKELKHKINASTIIKTKNMTDRKMVMPSTDDMSRKYKYDESSR